MWLALWAAFGVQIGSPADLVCARRHVITARNASCNGAIIAHPARHPGEGRDPF
jgi:hypothetical protein